MRSGILSKNIDNFTLLHYHQSKTASEERVMNKSFKHALYAAVCRGAEFRAKAEAFLGVPLLRLALSDKSGTPFESEYRLDKNGYFIENIPKERYLTDTPRKNGERIFDIRDYGASPDAHFKVNREAINRAISEASGTGGGVILVDGGEYTCANIRLKSHVTLRIERGSALSNITYDLDRAENGGFHALSENKVTGHNGFIFADNEEDIVIEGPGKLKGNGAAYCQPQKDSSLFYPLDTFDLKTYISEHRKRIMMGRDHEMSRYFIMAINHCRNVTVRNLEIYESGSWTCRMDGNENLTFDSVIINNNIRVANSDGIDVMGGKNTLIKNCFIATGDDGVCLKTDPDSEPLENLTVENCEIMSLANCFKIGTATYHDISDITVRNCRFFMPGIAGGYGGIAIEATDGGTVKDIDIENICMDHVTSPFVIWLGYRRDGSSLKNVRISDIKADGCDIGCSITGYRKGGKVFSVKNVSLENVEIKYRRAKEHVRIFAGRGAYEGPLNMGGYPESTRVSHMYIKSHSLSPYFDLPSCGLFVRNTDGLSVKNFKVASRSENKRPFSNFKYKEEYNIKNLSLL